MHPFKVSNGLLLAGIIGLSFLTQTSFAQENIYSDYRQISLGRPGPDKVSRYTLSSNLLDWALVIPNVGLEIDLGNPKMLKTPSLYFQIKGSPQSRHYLRDGVYDQICYTFWDAHAEIRRHFNFHRTNEDMKGRFYGGLYGEYIDYTLRTPVDVIDHNILKDGWGVIGGLSFGYGQPLFSYSNRHFVELEFGGNIGCIYTRYKAYDKKSEIFPEERHKCFPMVSELRFALCFRNYSIKRKYVEYDRDAYDRIVRRDYDEMRRADKLSEHLYASTPVLYCKTKASNDSILTHKLTLRSIREAFSDYLDANKLDMHKIIENPENTAFPIRKIGDHYQVIYRILVHSKEPGGTPVEYKYAFPFRILPESAEVAPESKPVNPTTIQEIQ